MTPLTDLLARLEKAEGPDRDLDADLAAHFTGGKRWPDERGFCIETVWPEGGDGATVIGEADYLTASLDASLALVERVLPGAVAHLFVFPTSGACWLFPIADDDAIRATAKTPPLALLTVLIKALLANPSPTQQGSGEARLNERNVEVSMLAHRWMVAHDKLAAGEPYEFPSPADVPALIARAQAAEARVAELEAPDVVAKLLRERNRCLMRIAALANALEPFAEASLSIDYKEPDSAPTWESAAAMSVSLGDFRRARAALSPILGGGE